MDIVGSYAPIVAIVTSIVDQTRPLTMVTMGAYEPDYVHFFVF
jgi:hypothetical protein